jgi:hypothetical protein
MQRNQRASNGTIRLYWMTPGDNGDGRRDPCMLPAAWRVLGLVLQAITLNRLASDVELFL